MTLARALSGGMLLALAGTGCLSIGCNPPTPVAGAADGARTPTSQPAIRPAPEAAPKPPLPAEALVPLDKLTPALEAPANLEQPKPVPARAKKLVIDAYKRIRRRDYAEAVDLLERAVGYDPQNARVRRALGIAYAGIPDRGRAEKHLLFAVKQAPDDLEVRLLLGHLALRGRQTPQAILHLRRALLCSGASSSNPLAAETLLTLAGALEREGRLTAALDCCDLLGEWIDRHAAAYARRGALREWVRRPERLMARRGHLLWKLRRPDEAIALLDRSYRLNRTEPRTAELLANALFETGQLDRAEKLLVDMAGQPTQTRRVPALLQAMIRTTGDKKLPARIYRAVVKRQPDNVLGVALAKLAEDLGEPEQAVDILQTILQTAPDSPVAAREVARLFAKTGRGPEGLALLVRILTANPAAEPAVREGAEAIARVELPEGFLERFADADDADDPGRRFARFYVAGRLARAKGQDDRAAHYYRAAAQAKPDFLPAHAALLETLLKQKKLDEAQKVLAAVRKAGGEEHLADYLAGKLLLARGKVPEAVAALQRAQGRRPEHFPTLVLLAEARVKTGQIFDAIEALQRARELRPGDVPVARKLFDLYRLTGSPERAAEVATELWKKRPEDPQTQLMQAELLIDTGRLKQALGILTRLAEKSPNDPDIVVQQVRAETGVDNSFPRKTDFDRAVARLDGVLHDRPKDLKARRMLARLNTRAGNSARAADAWKKVYQNSPDPLADAKPYVDALLRSEQYAPAVEVLQRLLDDTPDNLKVQALLSRALRELKEYDRAEAVVRKWLAAAPLASDKFVYREMLEKLYGQAKRYDKLQKHLDQWIAADGEAKPLFALRARKVQAFAQAGQFDRAVAYTRTWLKERPKDTIARSVLIDALAEQKDFDRALKLTDQWLKDADPAETEGLRRQKIVTYWRAKRMDQAVEYALDLLRKDPQTEQIRPVLISVLLEEKQYDRALTLLEGWLADYDAAPAATPPPAPETRPAPATGPAAKTRPAVEPAPAPKKAPPKRMSDDDATFCRNGRIMALMMSGKYAKALGHVEAELGTDRDNVNLLNQKSTCLTELGRAPEAIAILERVQRLSRNRELAAASADNNLSYLYAENGIKLARAESLAQAAVGAAAQAAFRDTLGWVYYKRAKLPRAGAVFRDLLADVEGGPEMHPVLLDHGGDVYYRLGWKDKAVASWKKALAEAKKNPRAAAEDRAILAGTPKKIQAVQDGHTPPVAPLGKGVLDPLRPPPPTKTHPLKAGVLEN